jgi:hypothetical protein
MGHGAIFRREAYMKKRKTMKMTGLLSIAAALMLILAAAVPVAQASIKDINSDNLSWSAGELTAGATWPISGTNLTWVITNPSPGIWHYQYTWEVGAGGKGNLSHFLLEVTNPAQAGDFFNFTNAALSSDDPRTYKALSPPNFEMPYNLYGIKFTAPGGEGWSTINVTFSFDSTHSPTWGDFFARDGSNGYAYNKNFSAAGVSSTLNDGFHAAVPNGAPVPIPGAIWLLGTGLLGLVTIRRRFRG